MSATEKIRKELGRLRQQLNEKEHSESELEALFKEIEDVIKQMTQLRGTIFAKLFSFKSRDLRKTIDGGPQ